MKKVLLMGSTALLSLGIGVAGSQFIPFSMSTEQKEVSATLNQAMEEPNSISIAAEWGSEPDSITDLFNKSDAVIIGKAVVKKDSANKVKTIQPVNFDNTIIYTEYDFKIKSILKGKSDSKTLDVINYGGKNDVGISVEWDGIEKLEKNETYLLFLEEIKAVEGMEEDPRVGKYRPIDGIAGTYLITSKDAATLKKLSKEDIVPVGELLNTTLSVEHQQINIQKEVVEAGLSGIIEETKP